MRMLLSRVQLDPEVTIGELSIDGKHECFVCEDTVREVLGQPVESWKVHGKTAIPYGVYQVVITWSNRFGRLLPLLVDVPGFQGIRIHPGNSASDTEGCLLPGLVRSAMGVGHSRPACDYLIPKIDRAIKSGEGCSIEIVCAPEKESA
jgi:hypothetical protein